MNRTRVIFIVIIVAALVIVGVAALLRSMNSSTGSSLVAEQRGPIQVRVLTALPVYDWVNEAAKQFNAEQRTLDGNVIQVEVISTDGLAALGRAEGRAAFRDQRAGSGRCGAVPDEICRLARAVLAHGPRARAWRVDHPLGRIALA
jgi:hypothetical protein